MNEKVATIDYTVNLPEQPVGHCCYHEKCVWISRVMTKQLFAAKLGYKLFLSIDMLRRYGNIPRGREGRFKARMVRGALIQYIKHRLYGLTHEEAYASVKSMLPTLPPGIIDYIERMLEYIYDNANTIVSENIDKAPPTGWRILSDDTLLLEPFMLPPKYLPRILSFATNLPRVYTDLVFCDETKCYPTPLGMWPSESWTVIVGEALRRDITDYVLSEFGATNIYDYLLSLDVEEAALILRPGKRRARVSLFVLVDDPVKHVVTVARLQMLTEKVTEQLEKLVVMELEEPVIDGYTALGITEKDVENAIKKVLLKKSSGF